MTETTLDFDRLRQLIEEETCSKENLLALLEYCEFCEELAEDQKETIDSLTYYIESALGQVISE
jgi:hypothetical protein